MKNNPTSAVRNLLKHSPKLRKQTWKNYRVKDGTKGTMAWRVRRITVWLEGPDGLPGAPHILLISRNPLNTDEVTFFLSNAPQVTSTEELLLVAFASHTNPN